MIYADILSETSSVNGRAENVWKRYDDALVTVIDEVCYVINYLAMHRYHHLTKHFDSRRCYRTGRHLTCSSTSDADCCATGGGADNATYRS